MLILSETKQNISRGNPLNIKQLRQIGIVGPGLIGGSVALALKTANIRAKIIGIGHRQTSIDKAISFGAIDEGSLDLKDLKHCQLVIVATPISLIKSTLDSLEHILTPNAVITDVGSTKRQICRWADKLFKKKIQFVGSHPVAGSEKRGIEFARHDLFLNANCFVTPVRKNSAEAVNLVSQLWQTVGMNVISTTPAEHDKLLALVSHLPHIVAAGLVNSCTQKQLEFTGTGFMDTTRIASGDVKLWTDIIMSNPDYIIRAIKKFSNQLENIANAINNSDDKKLTQLLSSAKSKRDKLIEFKYKHKQIEP